MIKCPIRKPPLLYLGDGCLKINCFCNQERNKTKSYISTIDLLEEVCIF